MAGPFCDLETLAAAIPDGAKLAVPEDADGVAMAATRALVRRGARGLHLVCVPVSRLQADVLIGAGCIDTIETSAVSLNEYGPAPRFVAAVRAGAVRILDATCPAIYAGLQAAQKGLPFMPLRGLLGSDVAARRGDWKVIDNPFAPGDPVLALPPIRPDVGLFHAPYADRQGNVFVGRARDGLLIAHAARSTLVTVEHIVERDLLRDAERAGGVIPSAYVSRIALTEHGAWPLGLAGSYGADHDALERYAAAAQSEEGFREWLAAWLAPEALPA